MAPREGWNPGDSGLVGAALRVDAATVDQHEGEGAVGEGSAAARVALEPGAGYPRRVLAGSNRYSGAPGRREFGAKSGQSGPRRLWMQRGGQWGHRRQQG
ncbi:MAG: hypothetical protein AB1609_09015 [Bacillota bacterium]